MTTIKIEEAQANLRDLLRRMRAGEEIVIADGEEPVARLLPFPTAGSRRTPGVDAGQIIIHANFDDPLPEFDR